jgi:tetratricopeptide (TPR) repeat protein
MFRFTIRDLLWLMVVVGGVASAFGQSTWVGKSFMPKFEAQVKNGFFVIDFPVPLIVNEDRGDWIDIGPGSIRKIDVIPLADAIAYYNDQIEQNPGNYLLHNHRAVAYHHKRDYAHALSDYAEAQKLKPSSHFPINNRAWLLATARDASIRNGPQAIELATRACQMTQWKNDLCIGTLAAAYAEIGDFDKAAELITKAMAMAPTTNASLRQKILEGFLDRNPYHQ